MKSVITVFSLVFLLSLFSVAALDVAYTVTFNGFNDTGLYTNSLTEQQNCDNNCTFTLPLFTLSEDVVFSNYSLTNATTDAYTVSFTSTATTVSTLVDDTVHVEVLSSPVVSPAIADDSNLSETEPTPQNITAALVCSPEQCDAACVVCSDQVCHDPAFICTEKASLEKYSPTTLGLGKQQLNVLLRNTGSVALTNVSVYASGAGISTVSVTPIDALPVGEKDYVFATVDVTQAGTIDLVLKIFFNGKVQDKLVEQLTVLEEQKLVPIVEEVNVTALTLQLDHLKEQYRDLEQEYQNKKIDAYNVEIVYDRLKETHASITEAQEALFDGNYAKVKGHVALATDGLSTIAQQLQAAKKPEQKFMDKLKANLIYVGTISAAIVSMFTAYGLIRMHVNKQKLVDLEAKLRFKKKQQTGAEVSVKKSDKKAKTKKASPNKSPEDDEDLKQNITEKMLEE